VSRDKSWHFFNINRVTRLVAATYIDIFGVEFYLCLLIAPCYDSSMSPLTTASSYLSICFLFLAPRPCNLAGAVDNGSSSFKGSGDGDREAARSSPARTRSGVLIDSVARSRQVNVIDCGSTA
jgi:hypothetical protein